MPLRYFAVRTTENNNCSISNHVCKHLLTVDGFRRQSNCTSLTSSAGCASFKPVTKI